MTTKITHDNDICDTLILLILKKIGVAVPHKKYGLHLSFYKGVYTLYTKELKTGARTIFIVGVNLPNFIDKILKFDYFPKGWF